MNAQHVEIVGNMARYVPIPDGKGSWLSWDKLEVFSERVGLIVIPAGSHNNLASIPRVARSFFAVNGPHRIAAIVHDYLYEQQGRLHGRKLTREECDGVFYDMMHMSKNAYYISLRVTTKRHMIRYGLEKAFLTTKPLVSPVTAWSMWSAVRVGGWAAWA